MRMREELRQRLLCFRKTQQQAGNATLKCDSYDMGDSAVAYVLIVDDDEDFAGAVATVLRSHGHEVEELHDTEPVLNHIEKRRPDALVLDVMFP